MQYTVPREGGAGLFNEYRNDTQYFVHIDLMYDYGQETPQFGMV